VDYLKENERRKALKHETYNPITGEGCNGERFKIEIPDMPIPILYLPVEMREDPFVLSIQKAGSITALAGNNRKKCLKYIIAFGEIRAKYDFEYFAACYESITDKDTSVIIPFTLRRPQRKVLAVLERMRLNNEPVRIILLKARQWGGSTLVQMYMLWIQICLRQHWNSTVCSFDESSSRGVSAMYDTSIGCMMNYMNKKYKISPFKRTQNILVLSESESRISIATAQKPNSIRSQDIKMAHLSEIGLYPNTKEKLTEDLVTSIVASISVQTPLTIIAIESTARGTGNYFHSQWLLAKKGKTNYEPIFVAWYEIEIYSKDFIPVASSNKKGQLYSFHGPGGKETRGTLSEFVNSLSDYERALYDSHKECTLENINWYRLMRGDMVSDGMMKQEYPSNDIEAFQNSGRPAFKVEDAERLRKGCRHPAMVGELVSEVNPYNGALDKRLRKGILQNIRFVEDTEALSYFDSKNEKLINQKCRNKMFIWKKPSPQKEVSNQYVVVYDPSRGVSESADFGDICVFNRYAMLEGGKPEVVAELHFKEDRDVAVWRAIMIAKYYHDALLVIESNTLDSTTGVYESEGEFIFDVIANEYYNLYTRTPADKVKEGAPVKWGFFTGRSEKIMLVAEHTAILREDGYIERDDDAVNETLLYEQKKDGTYGAVEGNHDDKTMTRMIGTYVCYSLPVPRLIEAKPRKKDGGETKATFYTM